MKLNPLHFVYGIALGIAEIIPGVSGSTIALLLGIYDDFIDLLFQGSELAKVIVLWIIRKKTWADLVGQFKAIRWGFGLMLGGGMLSAIIALSNVITYLLEHYPAHLFAVLFGLTPPTMFIVWKQIAKPRTTTHVITAITGVSLLGLFMLGGSNMATSNPHPLHLFIGGMVGVSTMVLPGVSGSFMLLVLGLYNFAVGLISDLSHAEISQAGLISLGIMFAGMMTGFLTTVRLIKFAFTHYRDQIMAFILGLLFASWYVLWPFVEVVGYDHGEPVLGKVSPLVMGLPTSLALLGLALFTAGAVQWLHAWSDSHDATPDKADDGFDKL